MIQTLCLQVSMPIACRNLEFWIHLFCRWLTRLLRTYLATYISAKKLLYAFYFIHFLCFFTKMFYFCVLLENKGKVYKKIYICIYMHVNIKYIYLHSYIKVYVCTHTTNCSVHSLSCFMNCLILTMYYIICGEGYKLQFCVVVRYLAEGGGGCRLPYHE